MILTMCVIAIHKLLGWCFSVIACNDCGMSQGVFFGSNVREARELAGWTRADFLRRLESNGVSMHATTLARIEDGQQIAKLPEALAMASLLNTTVEVLGNAENFAPVQRIKAARVVVKEKKLHVLSAWEEWINAGEDLLEALVAEGLKLDEEGQSSTMESYRVLTDKDQMIQELIAGDLGEYYITEFGKDYVEPVQGYKYSATSREAQDSVGDSVSTEHGEEDAQDQQVQDES